jgi:hypothetical protein
MSEGSTRNTTALAVLPDPRAPSPSKTGLKVGSVLYE